MRHSALLFGLILAGLCQAARNMTFLDVLHFHSVSQGTLSVDGRKFAYVVSSLDWKAGKRFTDMYLAEVAGPPGRPLTHTPDKDESEPAFSPDGRWLAFLSNRDGANQVYLLNLAGGEARKLTSANGGVSAFAFSRDGRWIAFQGGRQQARQLWLYELASEKTTPLARRPEGVSDWAWSPDSARIYFTSAEPPSESAAETEQRRAELKFDVRLVNPLRPARGLWQFELASRQATKLASPADFTVERFAVSPDGRFLTFTGGSTDRYATSAGSEGFLVDTSNGRMEQLTRNRTPESLPRVSPDGHWLAFTAAQDFTPFRRGRLHVRATAGGDWKQLAETWDGDLDRDFAWAADSGSVYFSDGIGVASEVFRMDLSAREPVQLTSRGGVLSANYAREAGQFVLLFEDPTRPRDYYLSAPGDLDRPDRWRRLSDANPQAADFNLGQYETVRWKSSDGATVEGLLVKPVGYQEGTRYPLIVQLHGGPAAASQRGFSASQGTYTHVFAAGGYAVFQPNYRGSSNYGEKFRMQISGDYFRQAFDDIMTGVDELIRRGVADQDKLGMMGWSAGGHWSNWTLTHTDRFKAISSGAGAVNWISMYAQTDMQDVREFYFQGKPWENWDHYIAVSPLRYIRNAKTPTLIHCGHDDPRVPRPQSEELHMALKKLGLPTEFIVYPRTGHGISEPRFQLVKMMSEYHWFEKWIRGKPWFRWQELLDSVPKEERER